MKLSKGMLNILVALALGLVATFFIHAYITSKTRTTSRRRSRWWWPTPASVPALPCARNFSRWSSGPRRLSRPRPPTTIRQVENRVVTVPLSKGEPILLSKLAPEGSAAGMGGLMRHDKLAVTVRTDDVTGVAGFLHPGDRVDVLVDMKMPDSEEHVSKIILQDITVLSTGQKWEQTAGQEAPGSQCRHPGIESGGGRNH